MTVLNLVHSPPGMLVLMGVGYLAGLGTDVGGPGNAGALHLVAKALLAVGLYSSVVGIDRATLYETRSVVVPAVTVGVVAKSAVIGLALYAWTGLPSAFVLGVAVAQIDPLAVAALLGDGQSRLSARGRTVLRAWSAFDDPVTVLMAIGWLGLLVPAAPGDAAFGSLLLGYAGGLGLNLAFAAVAYAIHRLAGRAAVDYVLLAAVLVAAVALDLMLAVAVVGLFLRPPMEALLGALTRLAFLMAVLIVGALLVRGVAVADGVVLAAGAVAAQAVVAAALTRGLPREDRVRLSLAQQNGITAVILAILLEARVPGAVGVVAPAIIFINLAHAAGNALADRWLPDKPASPST